MNKLGLSISTLFFLSVGAFAQKTPPASVQNAFSEKFPEAKSVKWEMESANEWEVDFKMNRNKMSASFDNKGDWQQTETSIKMNELPGAVVDAISAQFDSYEADEPEKIEMADGEVSYELELEKGKEEWEVVFSSEGQLLSKKMEKEDQD